MEWSAFVYLASNNGCNDEEGGNSSSTTRAGNKSPPSPTPKQCHQLDQFQECVCREHHHWRLQLGIVADRPKAVIKERDEEEEDVLSFGEKKQQCACISGYALQFCLSSRRFRHKKITVAWRQISLQISKQKKSPFSVTRKKIKNLKHYFGFSSSKELWRRYYIQRGMQMRIYDTETILIKPIFPNPS